MSDLFRAYVVLHAKSVSSKREKRERTVVLGGHPLFQLGRRNGTLEKRGQDAVHARLLAWRAGGTRVTEGGGYERDGRRGSGSGKGY